MHDVVDILKKISKIPPSPADLNSWINGDDFFTFLKDNTRDDEFVVLAMLPQTYIHTVFVPNSLLAPPDVDDLLSWNYNPSSSWGICSSFGTPPTISVSQPLDIAGSKIIEKGEQIIYMRSFEGRLGDKSYFEVLQKFVHLFGLHFLSERNAYCRIDERGDIEDVIMIVTSKDIGGTVITFKREVLDDYMVLADVSAVRTFDITRFEPGKFNGWPNNMERKRVIDDEIFFESSTVQNYAGFKRGVQIVRSVTPRSTVIKRLTSFERADREYESFIVHDFKNKKIVEVSSEPGASSNYFTKSDLPFEMSPVFFRPDVLLKYKQDSEKYRLHDGSISCRESWSLDTYDINDKGQVHTYLVYLRNLPYEEQKHWKAYNEKPKAPISKRAFQANFMGSFDLSYDAITSLKSALNELAEAHVSWWGMRSSGLVDKVHYPVTASADEWANELLNLDQLLVEGFKVDALREKAVALGRNPDKGFRSLKLLEECLIGLGLNEVDAAEVVGPFKELHDLRSKMKGHVSGAEGAEIKRKILTENGSYKNHFLKLLTSCDKSIGIVLDILK